MQVVATAKQPCRCELCALWFPGWKVPVGVIITFPWPIGCLSRKANMRPGTTEVIAFARTRRATWERICYSLTAFLAGCNGRGRCLASEGSHMDGLTSAPSESVETRLWRVYGRVQGVGFRAFVRRRALELGISGYARNMPDGSVEVLARGTASALAALYEDLERGPRYALVRNVTELPPSKAAPILERARLGSRDDFAVY